MSVPVSPHPRHHLLLSDFFILAILVGVKWYLVFLICISLMANDIQHRFLCFWAIYITSLEKCLFIFFAQFLIGLFVFLLLSSKSSLPILDASPLSDM